MPDPGEDYQRWSTVADNNGNVDLLIDWHEGQARRTVNNSARSEMAAHAKNRNLNNGSILTTGLPNAQAFLSGVNYLTIPTGLRAMLKVGPGLNNDGPLTLNMDGTGDISVKLPTLSECIGGEFISDRYVDLIFNGSFWIFLYSAGSFAPLESPVFTGDPQAPTPPPGDHDHSIATTEFVMEALFGGTGIVLGQKVFASPGTFTYVPAAGTKAVIIECIGGGGGGGAAWTAGNDATNYSGGGGGSGGYSRKHITGTDIGASQSITVGVGGLGGPSSGPSAGGTGGASFIGIADSELCKANGGGGGAPGWYNQMPHGGAGAAAGIGDLAIAGSPGENGVWSNTDERDPIIYSGNGAPGPFGGGARCVLAATGATATAHGAGGAAGSAFNTGGISIAGGAGSGGVIIITEFSGSGAIGPVGPIGATGPQGPIGPTGPTGPGTGDVLHSGTPTNGQIAQWTDASHIQGIAASTITAGLAPIASPTFTGNPQAPTPAPGDADTSIATTGFVATAISSVAGGGGGGGGDVPIAGRLTFVSTTQLKFAPYNGHLIQINSSQYSISTTGILGLGNTSIFLNGVGSSALAANTTYYVYAFINGGVVTGDFRTDGNGHITDITSGNVGVEVRCSTGTTPDPTRTLIGMCRTNASNQFVDSTAVRGVLSWFNRRPIVAQGKFTADRTTVSTTLIELNSEIAVGFLTWGNSAVVLGLAGAGFVSGLGSLTTKIYVDGAAVDGGVYSTSAAAGYSAPLGMIVALGGLNAVVEGYRVATVYGRVTSGTGTWMGPTSEGPTALTAEIVG